MVREYLKINKKGIGDEQEEEKRVEIVAISLCGFNGCSGVR